MDEALIEFEKAEPEKAELVRLTGLTFSPCGTRLVTVSPTGSVTFYNAKTFEGVGTMRLHEHVRRVAVLPDASGIITASSEGYVRLWPAARPEQRPPFRVHQSMATWCGKKLYIASRCKVMQTMADARSPIGSPLAG